MSNLCVYKTHKDYSRLYEFFQNHIWALEAVRGMEREELALTHGVKDKSYNTVRYGRIPDYSGRAEFKTSDGTKWLAIGHSPKGTPERVSEPGYIEYIKKKGNPK